MLVKVGLMKRLQYVESVIKTVTPRAFELFIDMRSSTETPSIQSFRSHIRRSENARFDIKPQLKHQPVLHHLPRRGNTVTETKLLGMPV